MDKDFISLLSSNTDILYKVCNLYSDVPEDRRDLSQEIVLELRKAFPTFRQESKISIRMYIKAFNTV